MSTPTEKQRPALRAVVNQGTREAPQYINVGAAWPHKRGFNLRLKDQAGNTTEIILFHNTPRPAAEAAEGGAA